MCAARHASARRHIPTAPELHDVSVSGSTRTRQRSWPRRAR